MADPLGCYADVFVCGDRAGRWRQDPGCEGISRFRVAFIPVAPVPPSQKSKSPGAWPGLGKGLNKMRIGGSQLSVLLEHRAAIAADAPAVCGKRRAAAEQVIPGHTAGMVCTAWLRRVCMAPIRQDRLRWRSWSKHRQAAHAAMIIFMLRQVPHFCLKAPAYPEFEAKATYFVRRTNASIGITLPP